MKIKNIEVGNMFLAPMAGVTDVGFRALAKKWGADLTYTEMINARALLHNSAQTKELLLTTDNEKIKVVQLFGKEPEIMAKACASKELENFDIIDINMGCPAPKIVKNGEGSALLLNLDRAKQIISACVNATTKPITVKMRIGYHVGDKQCLQLAKICEEVGVSAITIHGRTTSQMYSGTIDYETIKKVKESVKIPVVGNGDIIDESSLQKMLATGVDAVMIGRGALGKPWIFNQLKNQPIPKSFFAEINNHVQILREYYLDSFLSKYLRKHFLWYIQGFDGASKIRASISTIKDIDEALETMRSVIK